ncbi:MAG TPA: hypothetical protein PLY88_02405 [Candidatus Omnitrophota bacterium]|nr:hypothetical protein [Candidatus Omnitrophota bacterium]
MKYGSVFVLLLLTSLGVCSTAWAAPDFPPREKSPIQPVTTEQAAAEAALPNENVTPESAKSGKIGESALAEIHVTVLFGQSQNGEKSYKIDYKVIEKKKNETEEKEPAVKVSFKSKADKEKFAVSEVSVKKNENGTYKITAKIIETTPDEITKPKITYLD